MFLLETHKNLGCFQNEAVPTQVARFVPGAVEGFVGEPRGFMNTVCDIQGSRNLVLSAFQLTITI